MYNGGGGAANYIIAKASWELGEPAGISGVYRTPEGVNYYGTNPVGIPTTGQGTAVLFVGRKSDKTLLAVGTLSHIDDVAITGVTATQLITTNTKKVSFAVNAFKAGVSRNYSSSSFQISTPQPVTLPDIVIGGKSFPYFHIPVSTTATATYTIGVHSTATHPYSFYAPAIIYAGGAQCWNIEPHYTLPSYGAQNETEYSYNSAVTINLTSPTTAGSQFSGAVGFSIQTTVSNKVICALTFQVPVYAVYSTAESIQWNIKPGYNMYSHELDNGDLENGGAVLIGIGDIGGTITRGLIMVGEPKKYNNITSTGRDFTLDNFEIYFKNGLSLTNLTDAAHAPVGVTYPQYWGWAGLTFYYDHNNDDIADMPMTVPGPQQLPYGIIKIRVVYTYLSETYEYIFYVEVNNISSNIDIPYQNRIFIAKKDDYNQISNKVQAPGYYLFVFSESIDLPQQTINNLNANVTIFMVATVPNLFIGRENGTARTTFNGTGNVEIYIGRWPFNEPAFAGGDVINNEFFSISSRGTWQNYSGTPTVANTMFTHGTPGRLTINVLAGIDVSYPTYIGP